MKSKTMRRLEYITELMLKYMDGDVDAEKRLDELEDEDFMNEKIEEYLVENGISANNFDRYKYLHDDIQKEYSNNCTNYKYREPCSMS